MIPYGKHHLSDQDLKSVLETLRSDRITQGETINRFEEALCEEFGCDHAVAVSSGTTALTLAYRALGVEVGKRVLTTPNTFVATCNGILQNGGRPSLVDIDADTFNLSIDKLTSRFERAKGRENLIGITAVHFAGLPCEMETLCSLAEQHDLFLLEDACHAPGAKWKDSNGTWHRVGACDYSDAAILSFHPAKHFTTAEGGAVLTNDKALSQKVKQLRSHGITRDRSEWSENHGPWYYEMIELGVNGRLSDVHAALGLSQLHRFPDFLRRRRALARQYEDFFSGIKQVRTQHRPSNVQHAYHLYTIRTPNRDQLFAHLQDDGIQPQVHYVPVHFHPFYQRSFDYREGDFPEAEQYYAETISLPLYPSITGEEMKTVLRSLRSFYATG